MSILLFRPRRQHQKMPKAKRNPYLSPQEIQSTLSSPLVSLALYQHSLSHTLNQPHIHTYTPASQNPASIFKIPLIFDNICANLSNDDIWACLMVCRQWNFLARPHHWRSFRYLGTRSRPKGTLPPPIITTAVLNQLLETVSISWVRSLTLDLSCPHLLCMPFSNVVSFHLDCEESSESVISAEAPLKAVELLCRNPRLKNLTIKGVWKLAQNFDHRVLQFLRTSSLRFLDLGSLEDVSFALTQSILGNCPDTLEELRFDLSLCNVPQYYGSGSSLRHDARETAAQWTLPSLRHLAVNCSRIDHYLETVVCDLIQSCPSLHRLSLEKLCRQTEAMISSILGALMNSCPALNSIDMDRAIISEVDMLLFLDRCPRMRGLQIDIQPDHLRGVIQSLSRHYSSTLQVLRINANNLPSNSHGFIATILGSCSTLKELSFDENISNSPGIILQDLLSVKWATNSLERLSLVICAADLDQKRFLEEWRHYQCMYLGQDEIKPESEIAKFNSQVFLLKQLYETLQAQPNLTNRSLRWQRGWFAIPHEFADVITKGYLTVERLGWIPLYLKPVYMIDKEIRTTARERQEKEEEATINEKLNSCNISVVQVHPAVWQEEEEEEEGREGSNDCSLDLSSSWMPDDLEYSVYKSRRARARRAHRR